MNGPDYLIWVPEWMGCKGFCGPHIFSRTNAWWNPRERKLSSSHVQKDTKQTVQIREKKTKTQTEYKQASTKPKIEQKSHKSRKEKNKTSSSPLPLLSLSLSLSLAMADFERSYHHSYSSSYSYNPRLSTDQNQNPPFSLTSSRPSTDQTSYSYSYSYNPSRPSTDQTPPYNASNSYEYNGRLDIVPRQQPLPPVAVAPRPVAVVGSSSGPWCFGDPEMKRKRRVASYKAYSVEGKVKASIRKGFRWIKVKCSEIIHGW